MLDIKEKKKRQITLFIIYSIPVLITEAIFYSLIKKYFDTTYFMEGLLFGLIGISLSILFYLAGLSKYTNLGS